MHKGWWWVLVYWIVAFGWPGKRQREEADAPLAFKKRTLAGWLAG
jgi:hypothetical protein